MRVKSTFLTNAQKKFINMRVKSNDTVSVWNDITYTVPKTANEELTGFYDKTATINGKDYVLETHIPLPPDPTFAANLNFTTISQPMADQYWANLP